MTVEEVIAKLQELPPKMRVVVDLHSEYTEVTSVFPIVGRENGGYVSQVYSEADRIRACGFVYIGYRDANP